MAYQKGVPVTPVLETHARLYTDTSINAIKLKFPYDLGRFFEMPNSRGDFVPVAHGIDATRWVETQRRKGRKIDPLKEFPFPLLNYHTFAEEETKQFRIVPVEFIPDATIEPQLTPAEAEIRGMGYKAFEVYANQGAALHFIDSTRVQLRSKADPRRLRSPNTRGGKIATMGELCDSLDGIL